MWVLVRVGIMTIEKYILEKHRRDRNKGICWLMKCGKERAESIKTVKLINTMTLHYRFLWEPNTIMCMKMLYKKKKRSLFSGRKATHPRRIHYYIWPWIYLVILRLLSSFCVHRIIKPLRVHNVSTLMKHNKTLLLS